LFTFLGKREKKSFFQFQSCHQQQTLLATIVNIAVGERKQLATDESFKHFCQQ